MKLKKGFELRTICGENVIVASGLENINFSKIISVNETAAFLWNEAEKLETFTAEQLTEKLCGEYEVNPSQALADVKQTLTQWAEIGLTTE